MSDTILEQGNITTRIALIHNLRQQAASNFELPGIRVDVFMDRKGHVGRTILDVMEFSGIHDMVDYALDNSTATKYSIIRKSGKRLSGDVYVNYVLYLS
jgi:hypothetical protein